ncbi:MAG: DNA primase [Microcoleaceae cyanobacterium]
MQTPRIHSDTIEEVKQRADIYDVVSQQVVLKRRGKDFVGLCPFHEEKTPSFTVSPVKQMYYCFGCGAGGNSLKFLMELKKESFADVVLDLAQRYQVPVKTESPEQHQEFQRQLSLREQLYEILAIATSFYQHTLQQSEGKIALEYLKSTRQLTTETIQQFQLGYAPSGWETLYTYLVEQRQFPVNLVEQAGLIVPRKNGSGYYDRFRDRLMIPIHDAQGRTIGFGGRTLTDEQPKYLNSPETELFDKGKVLFGLDKAYSAISQQDKAIIVEGYFDVIALHAAGIENVVAALGTALSLHQVRLLLRYTESKQIILNFDGDSAGQKATQRAITEVETLAYQGGVQLSVLNLPDGKDADEFLSLYSAESYQELATHAPLWLDWQIHQFLSGRDLNKVVEAQQVEKQMLELLQKIENGLQRIHYIEYCAEILSQGQTRLIEVLSKSLQTQINKIRRTPQTQSNHQQKEPHLPFVSQGSLLGEAETALLRIYIHYPQHRQTILDAMDARDLEFSLSQNRLLWRSIVEIEQQFQGSVEQIDLCSSLQDYFSIKQEKLELSHLLFLDEMAQRRVLRAPLEIRAAIASIEFVICQKRRSYALQLWQETNWRENPDLAQSYQKQFSQEQEWINELERLRITTYKELSGIPLGKLADI